MLSKLKDLLIGPPLPTQQLGEKKLNKIRALAWPTGLAITGLLVIVAISYYQTIHGYPPGGGSYVVARDNLRTNIGLIAAATGDSSA